MQIYDIILNFVGGLVLIIFVLVGVAFLTLLERSVLGPYSFVSALTGLGIAV